jgi:putative FmdB family regulatory protein
MPEYDYLCAACGPFSETRPMAAYAEPQSCPGCGEAAPRALLTTPALAMMNQGQRKAYATNERSRNEPTVSSKHPSGCCCCKSQRIGATTAAMKGSPSRRPWMISH